MLILCREDITDSQRADLLEAARAAGLEPHPVGSRILVLGPGEAGALAGLAGVERLVDARDEPVLAGRGGRAGTTVVEVGGVRIGEGFAVMAGPCSVESRAQIIDLAHAVKDAGADLLRGGAFKPRTSPYSFQGLGVEGLRHLREAGDETGLPVVTEALDQRDVAAVAGHADMIQVGMRNMMNYALLREVGRAGRPVFLKRGMSATLKEFLLAAEYLLAEGCPGLVLCERGVRAFGSRTRFTLDLAAVPALRADCHLPVVVDPSHATGHRPLVPAMARAAAAAGAHGVMIEVHRNPDLALSDPHQALLPQHLPKLVAQMREIARIAARAEEGPAGGDPGGADR